jgi:hypothetical protein
MTKISHDATVEFASLARADQPATSRDEFGAAMRQAKASGNRAGAAPMNQDNQAGQAGGRATFAPAASIQAAVAGVATALQTAGYVNSIKSASNGADVAKTLESASNAHDIDPVLSELSSSQLDTVSKQLNGSGLSKNDLSTLCNSIVSGGASGQNLARLNEAFINNPPQPDIGSLVTGPLISNKPAPVDLASTLASAVAGRASVGTRVDYIRALGPTAATSGAAASVVGTVLASLRGNPQGVYQAFSSLAKTPAVLNAVLGASQGKLLAGIVNAAATKGVDPGLQATVFQSATQAFAALEQASKRQEGLPSPPPPLTDGLRKQDLAALTNLIESNPQGIVHELNLQDQDNKGGGVKGQALTTYAAGMLAAGDAKQMGYLLDQLRFGPGMNNDGYINAPANNYQNAQALGYFVGAFEKATAQNNGSDVYTVIGNAAGLLGVTPTGLVVGSPIQWWASYAKGVADNKNIAQQDALYQVAIHDKSEGDGYLIPSASFSAFQEGYSSVNPPHA